MTETCNVCNKSIEDKWSWKFCLTHEGHLKTIEEQIRAKEKIDLQRLLTLVMVEHPTSKIWRERLSGIIDCQNCNTSIHNGYGGNCNAYTQNVKNFIKKHWKHEITANEEFAGIFSDEYRNRILNAPTKELSDF